ncbi:MAG TPA: GTPase Era [Gammaproteobacteria bacterium]|nr:GTPase Era [Gammaproteobacteria bacterium]
MSENRKPEPFRCGLVALIGRPNVGKSTLLNHLLGQKLSITSRKPQTTRHQILGIKTTDRAQFVFVDTPGLHKPRKRALNRYLNRAASSVLPSVHAILFVVEALRWTEEDELVLEHVKRAGVPTILVVNKVDRLDDKAALLPYLAEVAQKHDFAAVVPVSALRHDNLDDLEAELLKLLPESAPMFPEDQITDRSVRFLAAEIIREKLMRSLGQELPYDLTVEVERFEEEGNLVRIGALIWVDRPNQKAIVIGKGGERLKQIGQQARKDIEAMLERKVFLELWVKVKSGWSDDERALQSLGYRNEFE